GRRHTSFLGSGSSDVSSSDLLRGRSRSATSAPTQQGRAVQRDVTASGWAIRHHARKAGTLSVPLSPGNIMISLLPDADRGHTRLAWLDSAHSFSFGDFYRKDHNGFGVLRVLNEDRVQPGRGFAPHGHANMEILSWVIDGELQHKDSAGNES